MAAAAESLVVTGQRRWHKRLAWASAIVMFLLGLAVWPVYTYMAHQRDLREAVAEADRLDPGWRFEDLEAKRAEVPDAENGALVVEEAYRLLPPKWLPPPPPGKGPGIDEILNELPANQSLDEKQIRELRAALGQAAPALPVARRLVDFPRGRFAVAWTKDTVGTLMPHLEHLRQVSRLLFFDSVIRARDGDVKGAMRSCEAALNACRSVGDEPAIGSQLARLTWGGPARGLERVLAQGEASSAALESLQHLLEQEMEKSSLLVAARAERAMTFQFLEVLRARKLDRRSLGPGEPLWATGRGPQLDGGRPGRPL
jgi:hypothetical protein